MFPYRRQGPKKRKGNPPRRGRGPSRPLPNSARELIPLLQPTTKALAQVLAGRSGDSGQLAHAQAVLAHAERLLADRQANRLHPAEREELLEQIARLKLTIADAESEAEGEAEVEELQRPPAAPVDRNRLREMALALGSPRPVQAPPQIASEELPETASRADAPPPAEAEPKPSAAEDEAAAPAKSEQNHRAGRLQLSASGGEAATTAVTLRGPVRRRGGRPPTRLKPVVRTDEPAEASDPEPSPPEPAEPAARGEPPAETPASSSAGNGHPAGTNGDEPPAAQTDRDDRRDRARRKGIPDGWVIDDEGFVVPGPA